MRLSEISQPKAVIDKAAIIKWLDSVGVTNYTIRDDGTVDVNGDVGLQSKNLQSIPIQFGHVAGGFSCSRNKVLTTLEGAPQYVGGDFYCAANNLTSLTGAPQLVGGSFGCWNNNLTSLAGAPQSVNGSFDCWGNPQLKMLPIFKIKGITDIHHEAGHILNKYYKPDGTGDIIAAQDELIDAGFGDIARMK